MKIVLLDSKLHTVPTPSPINVTFITVSWHVSGIFKDDVQNSVIVLAERTEFSQL